MDNSTLPSTKKKNTPLAFGEHFWVGTLWVRKNLWNSSSVLPKKGIVEVSGVVP
jgi:hypothetical protein